LSSTPIGESTDPILFQDQYVFFLQRPFDEVTDDAHALIAPTMDDDARNAIVVNADARVDSRYGMWDPESGQVVAAR
jgi:hypothetical protein